MGNTFTSVATEDSSASCRPQSQVNCAHWYAVQTRSNFERPLSLELSEKGVDAYLPTFTDVRRWKDRLKVMQAPLFPGYVFVRIHNSPDERLRVLRSSGAVRILGAGTRIEPIPEPEIDSIRCLLRARTPFSFHPYLTRGTRVRVRSGALRGVEGVLVTIKSRTRIVIRVELLSQSVSAEVDTADVEAVPSNQGVADREWICTQI